MKVTTKTQLLKPQLGDIFVVVHKNDSQCPYLIGHTKGNPSQVTLTNMHSGQANYVAESIEKVIELYLKENLEETEFTFIDERFEDSKQKNVKLPQLNPIQYYYFIKNHTATLDGQAFGHREVVIQE